METAVLPSGSVFTEKLCIQSFLKMWLCFGSVKPSKLTKSLYLLIETTLNHSNLQYFKWWFMIDKVCVLDLEVITSRLSSNWTRHRLYVKLYCLCSCGKLFSVFLTKTFIFLCIFLCFLKILLCFWLCFLSILGLQSPWKHCRDKWCIAIWRMITLDKTSKTCQNDFKLHTCGWFLSTLVSDLFWWVRFYILKYHPKPFISM